LAEDSNDSASALLLKSFSSDSKASAAVLDEKEKCYAWAIAIADDDADDTSKEKDKDIQIAGGIAATLNTLMAIVRVANEIAGAATDVSFNKDDPDYIGNQFSGKSPDEIADAIDTALGGDLSSIQGNIELLNETMNDIVPEGDTEISKKFDEFIEEFSDGSGGITPITKEDLANFIVHQWQ
jgi:hypothetical protein